MEVLEQTFAPAPESVRAARHRARDLAEGVLSSEQCYRFELLISELLANAVKYGSDSEHVRLRVTPKDGYFCVQVTDSGEGLMERPGAMGTDEHGGLGLFLVEQLARRWGMTREGGQTRVWFELDYA